MLWCLKQIDNGCLCSTGMHTSCMNTCRQDLLCVLQLVACRDLWDAASVTLCCTTPWQYYATVWLLYTALRGVKRQRHCRTFSQKLSPPLASSFLGTLLLAHVKPLSSWFLSSGCPVAAVPIPHTALQHTIYDTSLCVAVCGGGTDAVYVLIAYLP